VCSSTSRRFDAVTSVLLTESLTSESTDGFQTICVGVTRGNVIEVKWRDGRVQRVVRMRVGGGYSDVYGVRNVRCSPLNCLAVTAQLMTSNDEWRNSTCQLELLLQQLLLLLLLLLGTAQRLGSPR